MAGTACPSDRDVRAAMNNLKGYVAYKAHQCQAENGAMVRLEPALKTVETWAADEADTGKAWAKNREAESDDRIAAADQANAEVARDEDLAEKDAKARSEMDIDGSKKDMIKKLDDYEEAMRQLSEADKPGFAEKYKLVKAENAEAKEFLDSGLEEAMELTSKKSTAQRERRKANAERLDRDAEESRAWKKENSGRPEKHPSGQRADVQRALDTIVECCRAKGGELTPLGEDARKHVEALDDIESWAHDLHPRVNSSGDQLVKAKSSGAQGVSQTRQAFMEIEKYQTGIESKGNEDLEIYRQWTNYNDKLAARWISSSSAKHRQWAEAWMKTQE
ncbi:MAG: hypothetical protein ACYTHJ_11730 [Planctomycetota bacterium]|jgi:hypothetical protein